MTKQYKRTKISKKAGIFGAGMILMMIVFMSTAWFAFSTTNKKVAAEMELLPVLTSLYNEQDRFYLYLEETKKLASSQAYYETIKKLETGTINKNCRIEPNTKIAIWDSRCKPTDEIKKSFLEEFNKSFDFFIKAYPNEKLRQNYIHIFDENKNETIISKTQQAILETQKNGTFAIYNITFSTEQTETIITELKEQQISLDDFVKIYEEVVKERENCIETNQDCFKNLNFENWNRKVEKQGNYFFFELTTKKAFFFIEKNKMKFEPIKLKFILE